MAFLFNHPVATAFVLYGLVCLLAGVVVWKRANPARPDGRPERS